jgi:hypothetical protein
VRVLLCVSPPRPWIHANATKGGPCDLIQQDKEAEFRETQRLGMPVQIQNQPGKVQGMQYPQQGYQQQGYAGQYTQ